MMKEYLYLYVNKIVQVYLDDLLIYSKTWEEHLNHIETVLLVLRDRNLKAKLKFSIWGT